MNTLPLSSKDISVLRWILLCVLILAATPVKAAPPEQAGKNYTVKVGDTLSGIAARYGTTARAIRNANGLNSSIIYPGQRLRIPTRSGSSQSTTTISACNTWYRVQRDDILSAIARRCGITVSRIKQLNGLKNANYIYPGQMLQLYGTVQAPTPSSTVNLPIIQKSLDSQFAEPTVSAPGVTHTTALPTPPYP